MKGCSPLSNDQINIVLESFIGKNAIRNKALFLIGISTGFRISELLSLTISDIYDFNIKKAKSSIEVKKANTKGKVASRVAVVPESTKKAIDEYIQSLPEELVKRNNYAFFSTHEGKNGVSKRLTRQQIWNVFNGKGGVFAQAGISGKMGTHFMRKTLARRIFEKSGRDLLATKEVLGHRRVDSTVSYLQSTDDTLRKLMYDNDIKYDKPIPKKVEEKKLETIDENDEKYSENSEDEVIQVKKPAKKKGKRLSEKVKSRSKMKFRDESSDSDDDLLPIL